MYKIIWRSVPHDITPDMSITCDDFEEALGHLWWAARIYSQGIGGIISADGNCIYSLSVNVSDRRNNES